MMGKVSVGFQSEYIHSFWPVKSPNLQSLEPASLLSYPSIIQFNSLSSWVTFYYFRPNNGCPIFYGIARLEEREIAIASSNTFSGICRKEDRKEKNAMGSNVKPETAWFDVDNDVTVNSFQLSLLCVALRNCLESELMLNNWPKKGILIWSF